MGWFRVDRARRAGEDRFLYPKMGLFGAGAVAALLGIGLERGWLVDLAIGLLAVGIALRFLPGRSPPPTDT